MKASFGGVRVRSISSALPRRSLRLEELAGGFGDREVRRIVRRTGIESVRVAGALRTSDLCEGAARSLIRDTEVSPRAIDAIVLITQTPDYVMPATSAVLQSRLGLRSDCVAFDINYGCSGYVYGLYQAAMLIASGGCENVLLCTGDVITKLLDPDDRHVRMVFGDAATATLVGRGAGSLDFLFRTDGSGAVHLNTPLSYVEHCATSAEWGRLHMDGTEIMKFALESVPEAINTLLAQLRMRPEDVPLFLLHQANRFMLQYLARTLGVPEEKVPVQIRQVGNTGPSSIPLAMSIGVEGVNFKQNGLIACGFGVGLSVAVARLSLVGTRIVAPVELGPAKESVHRTYVHARELQDVENDLVRLRRSAVAANR